MRNILRLVLLALICTINAPLALAEKVSFTLPSGLWVNADYAGGDPTRPALLVLHGFLQTREFQATKNIIDGLSDMGFEALGPSLSLGVGNRRKSLSCEAPHTHTLDDDLEELDRWVNWLLKHGHKSVVLVGHSWGGQHALAYLEKYPDRPVAGVVAVSLVRTRQATDVLDTQNERARALLSESKPVLSSYALNFCKKYTGTPQSYLSYAQWTDDRVLEAVGKTGRPTYVILGGEDRRIDDEWVAALKKAGAEVSNISGADHFFSSQYEFDLLDELDSILNNFVVNRPG